MRLVDLEPYFIKYVDEKNRQREIPMAEADGVMFLCPKCYSSNNNTDVCTHSVLCWKPSVPGSATPGPGRWDWMGDSFENLSLVAGSSSVLLTGEEGCKAHFFVTNGEIVMLPN